MEEARQSAEPSGSHSEEPTEQQLLRMSETNPRIRKTSRLLHTAALEDTLVIADQERNRVHEQGGTARDCWRLLPDEPHWITVQQMVDALHLRFSGPRERIETEVRDWLQRCLAEDLVVSQNATPASDGLADAQASAT